MTVGTGAPLPTWAAGLTRPTATIRSFVLLSVNTGAGASVYHQQDTLAKPQPTGTWHPENWQTYYHIENWKTISSRPYLWGKFRMEHV